MKLQFAMCSLLFATAVMADYDDIQAEEEEALEEIIVTCPCNSACLDPCMQYWNGEVKFPPACSCFDYCRDNCPTRWKGEEWEGYSEEQEEAFQAWQRSRYDNITLDPGHPANDL